MSVIGPGTWRENALRRIASIHAQMPDATADELRKELRKHSGNFSGGTKWGAKVWPKACREYLVAEFGPVAAVKQKCVEDSPLFNTADHHFPYRES
jgi:hypothetical protein